MAESAPVELARFQYNPKTMGQKKIASCPAIKSKFKITKNSGGLSANKKAIIPIENEVIKDIFRTFSTTILLLLFSEDKVSTFKI